VRVSEQTPEPTTEFLGRLLHRGSSVNKGNLTPIPYMMLIEILDTELDSCH
jgi:hypothetical protein